MIDLSHPTQLPIIARLMDDAFNVAASWIEAKANSGETIDVLSVAERGVVGLTDEWDLIPGQVIVNEFKSSVADLRKDFDKPWRDPRGWAIGDYRLYWIHEDGPVRPEHVDESSGWGVVVFSEHNARIALTPQLFRQPNRWSQTELLMRLMRKKYASPQGGLSNRLKAAQRVTVNQYVKHAERLVEEYGPLTTGYIKGAVDWRGTGLALAKELDNSSKLHRPDGPTGSWMIKDGAE